MASANFYCMDYRVNVESTLYRSVELTFAAGFEADVSDHASYEPPAAFAPVIWYTTFRSTDEYSTFLDSIGPELPPSQSPIFAFATRTFGGQHEFSNFNLPIGGAGLADFTTYLNYHFGATYPAIVSAFETLNLSPSTKRIDVMNAIAQIIQPGVAAISWGS